MSSVNPITGAVAAALMLVASAGALNAQVPTGQDTARTPWPVDRGPTNFPSRTEPGATTAAAAVADTTFIRQAIRGNALEMRLGRVAQSRTDDSAVEDFARRMVTEHGSMSQQWATLARNSRVTVDTDLGPAEEQTVERLERLSGDAFDRAYIGDMIRYHERDLAAFQQAAATAQSPEVRRLATSGTTTIREHLALARQIGTAVGVSPVAAATPDTFRRPAPAAAGRTGEARDRDDRDRDDRGELRGTDRAFVMEVLSDHLMHVRLAERARREARSAETRRFAERMEEDFSRWQERWRDLASRHDLKAPKNLGRMHGQKVARLERASKQEVDRTYAAIVVEHLESVVPYFQKEGRAVRSAAVRRLVDDELPMIREQLQRARRLQGQASARAERD